MKLQTPSNVVVPPWAVCDIFRVAVGEVQGGLPPLDASLYTRLKVLRNELSRQYRLPPYGVFTNKTLESLARMRPTSIEAAMKIKGVGAVKAERFLKPFLELLRGES